MTVRKLKRSGAFGRWPAYVTERDTFGLWLYSPAGCVYRGEDGDAVVEIEVGQGSRTSGLPVLQLIPLDGWWTATWTAEAEKGWISIDVCTPPVFIDGEWTYVDLELDPHRFADGRIETLDQDEFEASCNAGLITPDERAAAIHTAAMLEDLLRREVEPFGQVGWQKLQAAVASPLSPITRF